MDLLAVLGARLKELRTERRMKQREVAALLKITHNHYQKIEYRKINISVSMLCTLANYYGVSTDYLLGRSEERT
ncbi:MAG: helix-turn-helix transcriptional regulator [Oscillibacter sp.]|nr:helix-turn-helix transcriptional regulator [Oscillibacter sp.]